MFTYNDRIKKHTHNAGHVSRFTDLVKQRCRDGRPRKQSIPISIRTGRERNEIVYAQTASCLRKQHWNHLCSGGHFKLLAYRE